MAPLSISHCQRLPLQNEPHPRLQGAAILSGNSSRLQTPRRVISFFRSSPRLWLLTPYERLMQLDTLSVKKYWSLAKFALTSDDVTRSGKSRCTRQRRAKAPALRKVSAAERTMKTSIHPVLERGKSPKNQPPSGENGRYVCPVRYF